MNATMTASSASPPSPASGEDLSSWRLAIAQRIAAGIDPERFGVRAVYVCESAKDATAGPDSDIDLLIHLERAHIGRRELEAWLEGWSLCLAEINCLRTGYRSTGLLHVHFVTDDLRLPLGEDSAIGAVTDVARPLIVGHRSFEHDMDGPSRYRERPGLYDG